MFLKGKLMDISYGLKNIAPKIQKDVSLETGSSWDGGQRMGRQSAFWVVGVDFRGLGLRESW